jgi:hypothetical protein
MQSTPRATNLVIVQHLVGNPARDQGIPASRVRWEPFDIR